MLNYSINFFLYLYFVQQSVTTLYVKKYDSWHDQRAFYYYKLKQISESEFVLHTLKIKFKNEFV